MGKNKRASLHFTVGLESPKQREFHFSLAKNNYIDLIRERARSEERQRLIRHRRARIQAQQSA